MHYERPADRAFLSGLCDRERIGQINVGQLRFLSGLCDREQEANRVFRCQGFLSGLCDRELKR